jgi:hypothetical protein
MTPLRPTPMHLSLPPTTHPLYISRTHVPSSLDLLSCPTHKTRPLLLLDIPSLLEIGAAHAPSTVMTECCVWLLRLEAAEAREEVRGATGGCYHLGACRMTATT